MSKYLYGASVQGIQEFIFKTNKLQEIIGASEIIKQINQKFIDDIKSYKTKLIMSAAGNMKAVFEDKDELQEFILKFKQEILNMAYGLTFSEAVVKIDSDESDNEERTKLEERLKIQRNRPNIALDMSLNITKLAPSTAKPIYKDKLDMASYQKRRQYSIWFKEQSKNNSNTKEYKELSNLSNSKNKIAVIHIDGNGLGMLIRDLKIPISEFSKNLDDATKEAYKMAKKDYKIRDVILGGDDVSVICDADVALSFTKDFLEEFEKKTQEKLGNKLTACAGIAICNEKYPIHYAYSLAEELCGEAKKDAKKINPDLAPSSLIFHNIQSSNFDSWDLYVQNELTLKNDQEMIRLDFGPYYLDEADKPKIEDFIYLTHIYRYDDSPINRLRNWLGELDKNSYLAKELLKRINEVSSNKVTECIDKVLVKFDENLSSQNLIIEKDGYLKTPIYDILQIISNIKAIKNEI